MNKKNLKEKLYSMVLPKKKIQHKKEKIKKKAIKKKESLLIRSLDLAKHYDKNFIPIDFIYKVKDYLSEDKCNLFTDFYNKYKDFAENDDLSIDKVVLNLRKSRDKDDEELKHVEKVFESLYSYMWIGQNRYLRVFSGIFKDYGVSYSKYEIKKNGGTKGSGECSRTRFKKGGLIYVIFLETSDVNLLFKYKNKKIKVKKGTLVIFPNHISYLSNLLSLPKSIFVFNYINYHP